MSSGETGVRYMDRSLGVGVGVVFVLAGALLAAPAPVSATGTAGAQGRSSAASQVTAAKKSSKGTLKIVITGSGTYMIKGKGFRRAGQAAKVYKVKPGRYMVKAPGAVVKPGKVRVRAGKTVRVRVTFPASAQAPPVTATPTPTPSATTPTTPPPSADVVLSRQVSLPPGSAAVVDLSPQVASLTSLTGSATDGPVSWSVDSGGLLTVSVAAGTAPGPRQVVATGVGCVTEDDCARSVSISIGVSVQPLTAPTGTPIEGFTAPSPDRVVAGLTTDDSPITTLRDEVLVTLGTADVPGGRADADGVAAAVDAVVSGGLEDLGIYELRWTSSQDIEARLVQIAALPGVAGVERSTVGGVDEARVPADGFGTDGSQTPPWWWAQINAPQAWDTSVGSNITVGVVEDDDVYLHPDLNVTYTRLGRPVGPGNTRPIVPGDHATSVAGLACAKPETAEGANVVGAAWGCPILSEGIQNLMPKAVLDGDRDVALAGALVVNNSIATDFDNKWTTLDDTWCATSDNQWAIDRGLAAYGDEQPGSPESFRRLFTSRIGRNVVWTIAAGNECGTGPYSSWGAPTTSIT